MQNNLILEKKFVISVHDCSPQGMRTYTMLQYIQDMAELHANQLGLGIKDMRQYNIYWVIVNIRLRLNAPPKFNSAITMKTWPQGNTPMLAKRAFEGWDDTAGKLAFAAHADFMLLDFSSKHPVNFAKAGVVVPNAHKESTVPEPTRLRPLQSYKLLDKRNVRYSAIDVNGHVNNTQYVRWSMDALHTHTRFQRAIHEIEITFLSEAFECESVEIMYHEIDADTVGLLGVSCERNVFLMQVTFK